MARKSKSVSVYERIEEKENQIKETEELLAKLNVFYITKFLECWEVTEKRVMSKCLGWDYLFQ